MAAVTKNNYDLWYFNILFNQNSDASIFVLLHEGDEESKKKVKNELEKMLREQREELEAFLKR